MGGESDMSEAFRIMENSDADRRLLLKLQHRLLQTPPQSQDLPQQTDDRIPAMIFALAPMTLAFFYLIVLSFFLFR